MVASRVQVRLARLCSTPTDNGLGLPLALA